MEYTNENSSSSSSNDKNNVNKDNNEEESALEVDKIVSTRNQSNLPNLENVQNGKNNQSTKLYVPSGRGGAGNFTSFSPRPGDRPSAFSSTSRSSHYGGGNNSAAAAAAAASPTSSRAEKVVKSTTVTMQAPQKRSVWAGRGGAGNLELAAAIMQSEDNDKKAAEEATQSSIRAEVEKEVNQQLKKPESAYLGKRKS